MDDNNLIKLQSDHIQALVWAASGLDLLDQRQLPQTVTYVQCHTVADICGAIQSMIVRGAQAIGIAAAYGVVIGLKECRSKLATGVQLEWQEQIRGDIRSLAGMRSTANYSVWVLDRMLRFIDSQIEEGATIEVIVDAAEKEAIAIHQNAVQSNYLLGQIGSNYIAETTVSTKSILTHGNTGFLATGGYGTALGVIRSCFSSDIIEHVFVGESRPWLQGSRLTAWELQQDGIPCTVIVDSAAPYVLSQGEVGWIVVGADRVAQNGDVVGKVGTYSLAIAAQYHQLKFMVVASLSAFDIELLSGIDMTLEERGEDEVLSWPDGSADRVSIALGGTRAMNPVFDITPAELIDVIVTERGVIENPDATAIHSILLSDQLH